MVDTTIASESQTNGSAKEITNEVSTKNVKNAGPNPLVICGPSGSGKSTILKSIMSQPKYKVDRGDLHARIQIPTGLRLGRLIRVITIMKIEIVAQ